ncbi:unnamed protein product [Nesidiocoris tenuis]|uniref:Uncharacterized protein n=1 Tax=Nesidiocoris tenuis TaxID=355587 RepID=A0A6H5HNP6_9HEMI|nr:unnamed protein product [Nesidiocoris tenuis]
MIVSHLVYGRFQNEHCSVCLGKYAHPSSSKFELHQHHHHKHHQHHHLPPPPPKSPPPRPPPHHHHQHQHHTSPHPHHHNDFYESSVLSGRYFLTPWIQKLLLAQLLLF